MTGKQKAKNKALKKRGRNSEFTNSSNMKQTQSGTKYASYEDFAHLLEEGLDDEIDKPKKKRKQK